MKILIVIQPKFFHLNLSFCKCVYTGVLIIFKFPDTEVLHKKATQNILDNYGKEFTWDVKVTLMGLQRENFSKKIVEIYELPMTWQEYSELVQIEIDLLMEDCQLCPGN